MSALDHPNRKFPLRPRRRVVTKSGITRRAQSRRAPVPAYQILRACAVSQMVCYLGMVAHERLLDLHLFLLNYCTFVRAASLKLHLLHLNLPSSGSQKVCYLVMQPSSCRFCPQAAHKRSATNYLGMAFSSKFDPVAAHKRSAPLEWRLLHPKFYPRVAHKRFLF